MGSPAPPSGRLSIAPSRSVAAPGAPVRRLRAVAVVAVVSWIVCTLVPPFSAAVAWPFWLVRAWLVLCLCAPPVFFAWAAPADPARRAWLSWTLGGVFVTVALVLLEPATNDAWWQGSIPETPGEYYGTLGTCTLSSLLLAAPAWWGFAKLAGRRVPSGG